MERQILDRLYQLRIDETMEKGMFEVKEKDGILWSTLLRDFIQSTINESKKQKQK
ncbi:hypothetical protein [Ralstonia pseudosolanacearum]